MVDATNELLFEILKSIQRDVAALRRSDEEKEIDLSAVGSHLAEIHKRIIGVDQDIGDLYAVLARYDERLGRIERRLQIVEAAE